MGRVGGRWWWLAWLAVALVTVGAYFLFIPADTWPREVVYDGIGLLSAVMVLVAVWRYRPPAAAVWRWSAAGLGLWVVGDVIYSIDVYVLEVEPFPSVADAFYLAAYPLFAIGLVVLARRRSGGADGAGVIDPAIIATGVAVLAWTFVMRPITDDDSLSRWAELIALAYPAADLLLLVMLVRLVVAGGARNASYRLLIAAVALQLVSDVAYSIQTSLSGYSGGWVDAGWMLSYAMWAAAALHPSMRHVAVAAPVPAARGLRHGRLLVLAGASLLAPALLLWQGATAGEVDWLVIGISAVVLFVLVVIRMAGLVHQVRRHADELAVAAVRDDLTGLANRRLLHQRLRALIADAPPARTHVAILDLDEFKAVNDRLGHLVGDQLLIAVSDRIAALTRPQDIVARLGGDEFAILICDANAAEAVAVITRIIAALDEPIAVAGQHLLVQASAGITDAVDVADGMELLRRADVALYAAKTIGAHGLVRYEPGLDDLNEEVAQLGAQLRLALTEHEFRLVYQPIVRLPDGAVTSVEALIRWQHPKRGPVSPVVFIPVAERTGVITDLGAWVIREACRQLAAWRTDLGELAPRRVSVNVSARQLRQPGFCAMVNSVLTETGLPASCLIVEITETAVFDGGHALVELAALQQLGVAIALDDFGTGHSSLSLLQTCPVDILKVDKSFIDPIETSTGRPVIAAALATVSAELNLTAVAEGVETDIQAEYLYQLGYRYAQGFYFARPMTPADLSQHLRPSSLLHPSPIGIPAARRRRRMLPSR